MAVGPAGESRHVQKVRTKLEKIFTSDNKKITPEALREEGKKIKKWITRHQGERINLQEKSIKLSPAPASPEVQKIFNELTTNKKGFPSLKERIKPAE
jgi:hypothetical protein